MLLYVDFYFFFYLFIFIFIFFFFKKKKKSGNTIRVSNSLDPDFVGPDLDPNCLQKLSADDKSRH